MNNLDPKYLNLEHLPGLKPGATLRIKDTYGHIETIIYRGYWLRKSALTGEMITHLLHERCDDIRLDHVHCSKLTYGDYFLSGTEGGRFELLEVIQPDFEIPLVVLEKAFQSRLLTVKQWLKTQRKSSFR